MKKGGECVEKYVKLDDVLECVFDFFLTEESDRTAFKEYVEDSCNIIDIEKE